MKILIAHLSDIHVKGPLDPVLKLGPQLASALFKSHVEAAATCIVLSGDVAFSGLVQEYECAEALLDSIVSNLKREGGGEVSVFMVPGNHDCDFSRDSIPRNATIDHLIKHSNEEPDGASIELCTSVQAPYFDFMEAGSNVKAAAGVGRLYWTSSISVNGRAVTLHGLNVSWLSQLDEKYGRLSYPLSVIKGITRQSGEVNALVFHHPLNWFQQGNMHELRRALRLVGDFVLTGHEHMQAASMIDDATTSEAMMLEAGALDPAEGAPSFSAVEIDLESDQYRVTLFQLQNERFLPREVAPSWISFRSLPSKKNIGFPISERFLNQLQDPGANFSHPTKGALRLEDIFVFPDLRPITDLEEAQKRVNSNTLLGTSADERAILVGDEKVGKTSLLFQLFQRFHDDGYLPIYMPGHEINATSARELDAIIGRGVERQYANTTAVAYWATRLEDRVCLLDDYDRIRVNERYRHKVISYLLKRFSRVFVTTTDAYQLEEVISSEAAEVLAQFRTYLILPFGHSLRYRLIRKWCAGGNEAAMSVAQMTELVDRNERIVNTVLGENFVPAIPLFLLTLLQSIETGKHGDLSQSAFGHYYSFLVARGLQAVKARPDELDEIFNYCAHLAYEMAKRDSRELNLGDIRAFTKWYSETFAEVGADIRVEQLCRAGILSRRGDCVVFKYPYFRYYFLGKYYADQISSREANTTVIEEIRNKCRNLHVRENANTVLFLTHHCKEPFVLEEIVGVLKQRFANRKPLRLEKDVDALSALVESATKIVVDEWDVESNREHVRRLQDEVDDHVKDSRMDNGSIQADVTESTPAAGVSGDTIN